jgi:hypothetical protein
MLGLGNGDLGDAERQEPGLEAECLREVATSHFQTDAEDLERQIEATLARGEEIMCVFLVAGDSRFMAFDDIEKVAVVAERYGLWCTWTPTKADRSSSAPGHHTRAAQRRAMVSATRSARDQAETGVPRSGGDVALRVTQGVPMTVAAAAGRPSNPHPHLSLRLPWSRSGRPPRSAADRGSAATASIDDARHVTQMIRSGGGSHPGAVPLRQQDWSWCGCPANHLLARTLCKLSERDGGETLQHAHPDPRTGRHPRRPHRTASCRSHEPAGPAAPAFPPSPPSVLPSTRTGN